MLDENIKIFLIEPYENYAHWQIFNLIQRIYSRNITKNLSEADIIWSFDPYQGYQNTIKKSILKNTKVIQTLDYIIIDKLKHEEITLLLKKEKYVNFFLTFCSESRIQACKIYEEAIVYKISVGVDKNKFYPNQSDYNIPKIKEKLQISKDKFVIGNINYKIDTFTQTDDFLYEKGTDKFINYIKTYSFKEIFVLLFNEQNNKLFKFLEKNNIEYKHFKNLSFSEMKKYYFCCDLVVNSSRYDGDSLNLLELTFKKVPTISINSGNAKRFLSKQSVGNSLYDLVPSAEESFKKSCVYTEKKFLKEVDKMIMLLISS